MRNPPRARNRALLFTLIGVAGIVVPFVVIGKPEKDTLAGVIPIIGGTVAFLGFCYLVYAQVEVWRYHRLVHGSPDAARWTIAPDVWRAFVALNDRLNAEPNADQYPLDAKQRDDPGPVEVVIDARALLIGDDFRSLPVGGTSAIYGPSWIEGPPACVEFRFVDLGGDRVASANWAVRVPIAPGSEAAAAAVFAQQRERLKVYLAERPPRNYRLLRNVALVVAVVTGAAFGVAISLAKRTPEEWQIAVMTTAIVGVLVSPFALLCAVVWHVRARRQPA